MKKIFYNREKARNIYKVEHKMVIKKVTEALAILEPWLYLEISNLLQQASELISSCIRILHHVDESWEFLAITSPNKPMLAKAASHIMNCYRIFVQVLDHLVSSIKNHVVVNTNNQSELVSRILCLLAIDKSSCVFLGVTFEGIEYNNTLDIGVTTQTNFKDRMRHLSIYGLSKNMYACFNNADNDIIKSLLYKLLIFYVDSVEKKNGML
ncbi:hypothetical protein G9A89_003397 [Geosiphon pyriformis]|nr:hypothetical protein G9A89_003397 [Geosiphon pyriformis]